MLFGGAAAAALVDLFYGPKEMCKVIRCDSFSELPGIHLGTSWTVRSAMLRPPLPKNHARGNGFIFGFHPFAPVPSNRKRKKKSTEGVT